MNFMIKLFPGAKMPTRATPQASGFDCFARIDRGLFDKKRAKAFRSCGYRCASCRRHDVNASVADVMVEVSVGAAHWLLSAPCVTEEES